MIGIAISYTKKDALRIVRQCIFFLFFTEVSHVVQVRAEGPKAPSPGHRPGYNGNHLFRNSTSLIPQHYSLTLFISA